MPERRHHQVPRRVGELVQEHDRPLAAVDDEARRRRARRPPRGRRRSPPRRPPPARMRGATAPRAVSSASCTSMIAAAAAPIPGRARAVRIHREPAQDRRRRGRSIDVVVIHTMEIAERDGAAEVCARWFQNPGVGGLGALLRRCRRRSSSACARRTSPGTLAAATRARSGSSSPASPGSGPSAGATPTAARSSSGRPRLTAEVCARHGIPVRRLRAADLVAGRRGVTGPRGRQRGVPQERPLGSRAPTFPWTRFLRLSARQRRRRARRRGLRRSRRARRA